MSQPTPRTSSPPRVSRRGVLIGGGVGVGLVVGWSLWPRETASTLAAAPGETVLGAFLKIGGDGRVVVVVPQVEAGQGIWTALPQALADELGADWRQVAVEPAPIGAAYVNRLAAEELAADALPTFLVGAANWAGDRWAERHQLMITAGSTSIRAFEPGFRAAGATARALLCMAAAKRLGIDWQACDTAAGFVVRGRDRFRFGDLAVEAAGFAPPDPPPLRRPGAGGVAGKAVPRIDLPAKVDGGARFAGDVRLPNMLYAAIRHGPLGATTLADADRAAAEKLPGVAAVVARQSWIAALASSWWTAERALLLAAPRFATHGAPDSAAIDRALDAALATGGTALVTIGGGKPLDGAGLLTAEYAVPLQPHAPIEPLVATARLDAGRVEVWAATESPSLTQAAVARALGLGTGMVTIYPMPVGGGFGRKLETDAAVEAALLAREAKRPVQLTWSRGEELQRAPHQPPAKARLRARLAGQRITAWSAVNAAPPLGGLVDRLTGSEGAPRAEHAALAGGTPPYAIPAVAIAHAPAAIGLATGLGRGLAHRYTAFFGESFIDELAAAAQLDPLSFRIAQLGDNPRLARCLTRVTAAGGWSGEAGAAQGLAIHSAFGSHIALLAEATLAGDGIRVARLFAAVDCGRLINPDIVTQMIESGLIWGLAAALGGATHYMQGVADALTLDSLHLPRLKDMPEIAIELIPSPEAPGGAADLAVPLVAPAIANAIASATGKRLRRLPLS